MGKSVGSDHKHDFTSEVAKQLPPNKLGVSFWLLLRVCECGKNKAFYMGSKSGVKEYVDAKKLRLHIAEKSALQG
jgi:hypothetical protein